MEIEQSKGNPVLGVDVYPEISFRSKGRIIKLRGCWDEHLAVVEYYLAPTTRESKMTRRSVCFHKDHMNDEYQPHGVATIEDCGNGDLAIMVTVKMVDRKTQRVNYLVIIYDVDGKEMLKEVFPSPPRFERGSNYSKYEISSDNTDVTHTIRLDQMTKEDQSRFVIDHWSFELHVFWIVVHVYFQSFHFQSFQFPQ